MIKGRIRRDMFFVINKEKIFSFVLAVGMVGVLLGMTDSMTNESNTAETSSSVVQNQVIVNQTR